MTDLWESEGFGGEAPDPGDGGDDDWDEGDESLETGLEDGFVDPDDELDDESWDEGDGE
jgi:hypothetical protein